MCDREILKQQVRELTLQVNEYREMIGRLLDKHEPRLTCEGFPIRPGDDIWLPNVEGQSEIQVVVTGINRDVVPNLVEVSFHDNPWEPQRLSACFKYRGCAKEARGLEKTP